MDKTPFITNWEVIGYASFSFLLFFFPPILIPTFKVQ